MNIGVDLGGTNVRAGVVDEAGNILKEMNCPTEAEKGPEYTIHRIEQMILELKKDFDIEHVGIGSPGPLDAKKGIIIEPPNLPGWSNIPLTSIIQEKTGLKVYLDNDANAAALAEALIGAGKAADSVFYITVSTGIGGGFVYKKQLFQGAQGYCGEIGNMIVNPQAAGAPGLNKGALEALASGTAIARKGKQLLGLSGNAGDVFLLCEQGNEQAQNIVDEALSYLAIGIANIVHTLNPEVIVLGGGVMKSSHLVLQPLKEKVKHLLYPSLREHLELKVAELDQKAGLIGASLLPNQRDY